MNTCSSPTKDMDLPSRKIVLNSSRLRRSFLPSISVVATRKRLKPKVHEMGAPHAFLLNSDNCLLRVLASRTHAGGRAQLDQFSIFLLTNEGISSKIMYRISC